MDEEEYTQHNPLLKRLARKNTQPPAYWKSKKLEKGLAKRVGGRRTSGSGNKKEKGDVRKSGVARLEHKATHAKSFSVTKDMLDKIENAALANNELPAIVITFLSEDGRKDREVAVVPLDDLLRLL